MRTRVARLRVQRVDDLRHADGAVRANRSVALCLNLADGDGVACALFVLVRKAARVAPRVALPAHVRRRLLHALLCTRSRYCARHKHGGGKEALLSSGDVSNYARAATRDDG